MEKRIIRYVDASFVLAGLLAGGGAVNAADTPKGTTATLAVLETSDLHANVLSYDYFKLGENGSFGLERTATLIRQARSENPNSILIDCGDTIQGTALADYQAVVNPVTPNQDLAIYKVMNILGYEAGTLGNHEFNYGIAYLGRVLGKQLDVKATPGEADPATQKVCGGPNFPMVCANVLSAKTGRPLVPPYTIITKYLQATAPDGKTIQAPVKVGLIGFCTPQITTWDRRWLTGIVTTTGLKEAAEKYLPEMRARGAEVIVAISHGGIDPSAYSATMENGNYHLAQVPGLDALLMGHVHQAFPGPFYKNIANVDNTNGTIFGVPALMPGFWGNQLGVIKLALTFDGTSWHSAATKATAACRPVLLNGAVNPKVYVAADPAIAPMIAAEHQATIAYVKTPVGKSDFGMSTLFAEFGEVSAIQIVNMAQADYVSRYVASNLPQYRDLPVLSVSAPFKSGAGGGADFTDVKAGPVAINNAADLYLYPNTVCAVKVTGAELRTWLEAVAGRFNRLDPAVATPQELVDQSFPGYNFDMFTSRDLTYEIDVTQPKGSRIKNLSYKGAALSATGSFIIATNNYRASGGGGFVNPANMILASPDMNRDVLIAYIKDLGTLTRAKQGSDRSWHFTKVPGVVARLHSTANRLSTATDAGLGNVSLETADDGSGKGLASYTLDLGKSFSQ